MLRRNHSFSIILVVNQNDVKDLIACLNNLVKIDYPYYEIILVANGSVDACTKLLKVFNLFNKVTLLKKETRIYNFDAERLAISKAKGEYFLLMNVYDLVKANIFSYLNNKIEESSENINALRFNADIVEQEKPKSNINFDTIKFDGLIEGNILLSHYFKTNKDFLLPYLYVFKTECIKRFQNKYIKMYIMHEQVKSCAEMLLIPMYLYKIGNVINITEHLYVCNLTKHYIGGHIKSRYEEASEVLSEMCLALSFSEEIVDCYDMQYASEKKIRLINLYNDRMTYLNRIIAYLIDLKNNTKKEVF